jgi:hypothetical protein
MMFVGNMGALLAAVCVTLCDAARQHQDYRGTPQKARIIRLYQGIQGTPSTSAALHLLMHVLIWNFDMFASTFVAYSRVLVPLNRLHQAVYARCLERERRLLEAPSVAPELKNLNLGDWNEPFAKKPVIFALMQKMLDKGTLNEPPFQNSVV